MDNEAKAHGIETRNLRGICDYCNEAYEYPEGYAVCKCNELHGEQQ